ncbi:MAG: hypothetical protein FJ387_23640 [Verrucomicrobia bacterium]|nr:hypothetical protein [Verrucomicrobiota bacterium]
MDSLGRREFITALGLGAVAVPSLNSLVANGNAIQGGDVKIEASLSKEVVLGPFAPQPAFTMYVVSDGGVGPAKVTIRRGVRPERDRLMIRAFDQEERLSFWKYAEVGTAQREKPAPGELLAEFEVPLVGNGVNQIRVTAGECNSLVAITLPRAMPYGVSFQNGTFSAWKGQPGELYAYVPPRAEELHVSGIKGPLRVVDEGGVELPSTGKIVVGKTKSIWKFIFPDPKKWSFSAYGFPLILCPTPDAARAIQASVEELSDGTVVCHKSCARTRSSGRILWSMWPSGSSKRRNVMDCTWTSWALTRLRCAV